MHSNAFIINSFYGKFAHRDMSPVIEIFTLSLNAEEEAEREVM